jgi:hypothetical protein
MVVTTPATSSLSVTKSSKTLAAASGFFHPTRVSATRCGSLQSQQSRAGNGEVNYRSSTSITTVDQA